LIFEQVILESAWLGPNNPFNSRMLLEQKKTITCPHPHTHTKLVFYTVNYKIAQWSDQSYNMETQRKVTQFIKTYLPTENESESRSVVSDSLWPLGLCSPWNSPSQNTEGITFPFSRRSSQPMDQTQVSHIAGRLFTSWATKEVQEKRGGFKLGSNNIKVRWRSENDKATL